MISTIPLGVVLFYYKKTLMSYKLVVLQNFIKMITSVYMLLFVQQIKTAHSHSMSSFYPR